MTNLLNSIAKVFGFEQEAAEDPLNHLELQSVTPPMSKEEETALEYQFIRQLYQMARDEAKVPKDQPLKDGELFFNMIFTEKNNQFAWWMPTTHPIAQMMFQSYAETHLPCFAYVKLCNNQYGSVVCYNDAQMDSCVADIVKLCKKHNLDILVTQPETEAPPILVEKPIPVTLHTAKKNE